MRGLPCTRPAHLFHFAILTFEKFKKSLESPIEKLSENGYNIVEKFCEVSHHAET